MLDHAARYKCMYICMYVCRSFFLSFSFFSFANGSSRLIYRQRTFIAQKVGYRYNFINWDQNLGVTPIKISGPKISPNFVISDFCNFFCPFLQNGVRYQQSENGLLKYRPDDIKWCTSAHHELRDRI